MLTNGRQNLRSLNRIGAWILCNRRFYNTVARHSGEGRVGEYGTDSDERGALVERVDGTIERAWMPQGVAHWNGHADSGAAGFAVDVESAAEDVDALLNTDQAERTGVVGARAMKTDAIVAH